MNGYYSIQMDTYTLVRCKPPSGAFRSPSGPAGLRRGSRGSTGAPKPVTQPYYNMPWRGRHLQCQTNNHRNSLQLITRKLSSTLNVMVTGIYVFVFMVQDLLRVTSFKREKVVTEFAIL